MNKICFLVMPFGIKDTGLESGGPKEVNFDQLWEKVYKSVLEELGYTPVRADAELGSLIINEMIKSLISSDVVLADTSISNANVYYEIGVRHAACKFGSIIVQANWAIPAFDIQQMRAIRFPLDTCDVSVQQAAEIKAILHANFEAFALKRTPVYEVIPSMNCTFDESQFEDSQEERLFKFRKHIEQLNDLMASIRAVRLIPNTLPDKKKRGLEVLKRVNQSEARLKDKVQLEVMSLLRDCTLWQQAFDFIENMPDSLKTMPQVKEQRLLALSELNGPLDAAGHLEELIRKHGASSERYGLLGGRYKRLYRMALENGQKDVASYYLNKAIEAYTMGMQQDLNDYFPSCNLPQLLKARGSGDDLARAKSIAVVVLAACERAKSRNIEDVYLNPTLLGAAFDTEDIDEAKRLTDKITSENLQQFVLNNTLPDLEQRARQSKNSFTRKQLVALVQRLRVLSE